MYNKCVLIGNLCQDVELKEVGEKKTKVAKSTIAVNDHNKNVKPVFLDIQVWGARAETLSKYTKKGSKILVEGKLTDNSWEKDGQKIKAFVLNVNDFQFLDPKSSEDTANPTSAGDDSASGDDIPF